MILVQAPPALTQPAPAAPLRAQYGWGYSGSDGEGVGTLSLLLETTTGRLVVELHAQGERVMVLEGDGATGYRLQVPRQQLDERAPSLATLPLPFLPQVATVEALSRLLRKGEGLGVTVLKRDAQGPLRLHWKGKDAKGKDQQVWLDRKRWEPGS